MTCGHSRYKPRTGRGKTLVAYKKLRYFPITPRLQRLFMSPRTPEHMTWHQSHHAVDGVMVHPSDGEAWKHFNSMHPHLSAESMNVRLGLCTDGFNLARFFDLLRDSDEPLWDGCTNHSKLSAVAQVFTIKSDHGLSEAGYDKIIEWARSILPERNRLKENFYAAKSVMKPLGLGYQKIDICPNFCMLYYLENAEMTECMTCRHSRYKPKTGRGKTLVAYKKLRYFPITPRLQRLFMSPRTTENMTWHQSHHAVDGVMVHPSDGEAWKPFNSMHPHLSAESMNVRLGLCTDGFNLARFFDLLRDSDEPLWDGCTNHSKLSAVAQVFTIKSDHGLSEAGYDKIIEWARSILPERNRLKENFYAAKSVMKPLGLGYQKIDICPNFCMLYYLENAEMTECMTCGHSRYKPRTGRGKTLVAYKKLRYFPITPRLQRLFMSPRTPEHMTWHQSHHAVDGVMVHPSDGEAGNTLTVCILTCHLNQ
jgi:hypothetical protein